MAELTQYRTLFVVTPEPLPGEGGAAIQYNFKELVDWHPQSVWDASTNPSGSDNSLEGFYPGSLWLNASVTPPKLFVLTTETVVGPTTTATWQQVLVEVVQDPSPQLGGTLDVNGQAIGNPSGSVVLTAGGRTSVTVKNSGGDEGFPNEVFVGPTTTMPARGLPLVIESNAPGYAFYETDMTFGNNLRGWDFLASAGALYFRCMNDAINDAKIWLKLDRSGYTPSLLTLSVDTKFTGKVVGPMNHQQTHCENRVATTVGTDATFNLLLSDVHQVVLTGNRTLVLNNPQIGQRFLITLKQDSTGSRTVTWWSGITWPNGTAPTLTTTANKSDVFEFLCTASGAYFGRVWGQNF